MEWGFSFLVKEMTMIWLSNTIIKHSLVGKKKILQVSTRANLKWFVSLILLRAELISYLTGDVWGWSGDLTYVQEAMATKPPYDSQAFSVCWRISKTRFLTLKKIFMKNFLKSHLQRSGEDPHRFIKWQIFIPDTKILTNIWIGAKKAKT